MSCIDGKHSGALPGCGLVRQRIGSHVTSAPQRLGISSKLVPSLQIQAIIAMITNDDEIDRARSTAVRMTQLMEMQW